MTKGTYMKAKVFPLRMEDGEYIQFYSWEPSTTIPIQGIVQIIHGMTEYAERYTDLAKELVQLGYIVYADDHRGHGKTVSKLEEVSHLKKDEWEQMIRDEQTITRYIHKWYPEAPIFLLGHSMGSFIIREYMTRESSYVTGVILSGSGYFLWPSYFLGSYYAKLESLLCGPMHRSRSLERMSFGKFNRRIKNPKTKFDWLTSNEEIIDAYIESDYCGKTCTSKFYEEFFKGIGLAHSKKRMDFISKDIPILLIAGEQDPVGDYGKGVKKLYKLYQALNIKQVYLQLYKEARHEWFFDISIKEAANTLIAFFQSCSK